MDIGKLRCGCDTLHCDCGNRRGELDKGGINATFALMEHYDC